MCFIKTLFFDVTRLIHSVSIGLFIECQSVRGGHMSSAILLGFQHGLNRCRMQAGLGRADRVNHHELEAIARSRQSGYGDNL